MAYKIRNTKNEDGTYTLSFGRGRNKLTAVMEHGAKWGVQDSSLAGQTYVTMKECKAAWGEWAENNYGKPSGSKDEVETPPVPSSPALPPVPDLPAAKPPESRRGVLYEQYAADPFDPRFRSGKEFTALGVLVELRAYCLRYADVIKKVEEETYPQRPFTGILEQAEYTLRRDCPDIFNGDTNAPAEPQQPTVKTGPPPVPSFDKPAPAAPGYDNPAAQAALDSFDPDDIPF